MFIHLLMFRAISVPPLVFSFRLPVGGIFTASAAAQVS